MAWSPSPQVAVARDAARGLGADMGAIVVYFDSRDGIGMASYGANRELCRVIGEVGNICIAKAMDYFEDEPAATEEP